MPTIPITINEAGDLIDAGTVNNDFTQFALYTQDLDGDNTRTEWCSRAHISNPPSSPVFNTPFNMVEDSNSTQFVNWNTFQQINLAPAFRVTYGSLTIEPGQVLRASLDINVLAATYDAGALDGTINTEDDCYQFRFYFRDATSGVISPIGPTATYSLTNQWNIAFPAPGYTRAPTYRIGQRCNLSMVYVNTTGNNLVIDWFEARVRVMNTAVVTSISIGQGEMVVMKGNY